MQLLVSVRSAAEVSSALEGGADIIDAKEPNRGSLGAVSPAVLKQIFRGIPPDVPASVALGDLRDEAGLFEAVLAVPRDARVFTYLKLGFAGVTQPEVVRRLLRAALDAVAGRRVGIIAVAYADTAAAGSPSPRTLSRIAAEVVVDGVLLDTYRKGDGNLLSWLGRSELASFVSDARRSGLLTALAGGLGEEDLATIHRAGPDVVGFRGAVSIGGREGLVSAARVRSISRQLNALNGAGYHPNGASARQLGETPGVPRFPTGADELTL